MIEVIRVFFKLGLTAFGGPAAHIAMMESEVVEKRKWMSQDHFLDLIGATNLIPGPNSTEMAMHCGFHRAGWRGLIAAGMAFIFPAFFLTLLLASLYIQFGTLSYVEPFVWGVKPAMIALVAFALVKLGKKAANTPAKWLIGLIVLAMVAGGVSEIVSVLVGGVLGAAWEGMRMRRGRLRSVALPVLFLECLKIGAILYGSGYVLIAYVDSAFVDRLGWLSSGALLDAVAIGQLTPGPVLTTATVIGYFMAGVPGAIVATIGIFLPSFGFVLVLNPVIDRIRKWPVSSGFLDGVNVAAVALMLYVTAKLGLQIVSNWGALLILGVSAWILWKKPFGIGSVGLIVVSALLGAGITILNNMF